MLYTDFLEYYNVYCAVDPQMVRVCLEYAMKGTTSADCNVANPCDPDDILNLRQSAEQMPRYKIGNEARCFATL